jgi:putative Mg2+ transporter-C (MgtC) family protein
MLLRLAVAFALGLPVGWEREHRHRSPGLRTFPLVAMGSCAFLLIGEYAYPTNEEASARVLQGLLSGIGFIGAGAIIKGNAEVHGIATAVAIWITAATGAAVAYGLYWMGAVLSLSTLLTLRALATRR